MVRTRPESSKDLQAPTQLPPRIRQRRREAFIVEARRGRACAEDGPLADEPLVKAAREASKGQKQPYTAAELGVK